MLSLQELSLQHISNILWTYASFLHLPPNMVTRFVGEVRARLASDAFNAQQLSNVLWSLCICQVTCLPICSLYLFVASHCQGLGTGQCTESFLKELIGIFWPNEDALSF